MKQDLSWRAQGVRLPRYTRSYGFGAATGIVTLDGIRPAEALRPGDRIVTRDRGAVRLAGIQRLETDPDRMVEITPAAMSGKNDAWPFQVAENQQVLVTGWRARVLFNRSHILVPAKRLIDGEFFARPRPGLPVRLLQLLFDDGDHLVQSACGLWFPSRNRQPEPAR